MMPALSFAAATTVAVAVLVASGRGRPFRMRGLEIVLMALIALLGGKLMDVGVVSNVGGILYAGVLVLQLAVARTAGWEMAATSARMVAFNLAAFTALAYLVGSFPAVPGNEAYSAAAAFLTGFSLRVVAASFVAFALSQAVLLLAARRWRSRYALPLALAQVADSLAFYPVAFGSLAAVLPGLTVKLVATALLYPAYRFAARPRSGRDAAAPAPTRVAE